MNATTETPVKLIHFDNVHIKLDHLFGALFSANYALAQIIKNESDKKTEKTLLDGIFCQITLIGDELYKLKRWVKILDDNQPQNAQEVKALVLERLEDSGHDPKFLEGFFASFGSCDTPEQVHDFNDMRREHHSPQRMADHDMPIREVL